MKCKENYERKFRTHAAFVAIRPEGGTVVVEAEGVLKEDVAALAAELECSGFAEKVRAEGFGIRLCGPDAWMCGSGSLEDAVRDILTEMNYDVNFLS